MPRSTNKYRQSCAHHLRKSGPKGKEQAGASIIPAGTTRGKIPQETDMS